MAGLRILLVAAFLLGATGYGDPAAAEPTLKIGGTGAALGGAQHLLDGLAKQRPEITGIVLPSVGTSGAIKAVAAGALDVGLTSRPLMPAERDMGLVSVPSARRRWCSRCAATIRATRSADGNRRDL